MTEPNTLKIDQPDSDGLIMRAKEGDKKAFEQMIRIYRPLIYGIANNIMKYNSDIEDVIQEVFIDIHRYLATSDVSSEAHFKSWAYRITANTCFYYLNQRKKQSYKHEVHGLEASVYATNLGTDPSIELYRKELAEIINDAVYNLPEDQRVAIIMRSMEEMSAEEMADALNVPISTIGSRIVDARDKLRKSLKILAEEYGISKKKKKCDKMWLKTAILERVQTPEEWVNMGITPRQRKQFKIEGMGLSAIGSQFGVVGHVVGYIQLYLELGRKLFGEHHECLQYKEKTEPSIDELKSEIKKIIPTFERWKTMIIREKKQLKVFGIGIYALTKKFGLEGNPVSNKELFFELGKRIYCD